MKGYTFGLTSPIIVLLQKLNANKGLALTVECKQSLNYRKLTPYIVDESRYSPLPPTSLLIVAWSRREVELMNASQAKERALIFSFLSHEVCFTFCSVQIELDAYLVPHKRKGAKIWRTKERDVERPT